MCNLDNECTLQIRPAVRIFPAMHSHLYKLIGTPQIGFGGEGWYPDYYLEYP